MDYKFLNKISSLVFYLAIFSFMIAFNFAHNPPSGWYQQFLPNLNGQPLSDIKFLDSLNGFAITDNDFSNDTGYIIKTTNGGDIWNIIFQDDRDFKAIQFININVGYICGADPFTSSNLLKTTNSGLNWLDVHPPDPALTLDDIAVISEDTLWVTASSSFSGGVFRTTNGGINWTQQLNLGSLNPDHIYMFNSRIGFISEYNSGAPYVRKTTDGGQNWFVVVSTGAFTDMYFLDSLNGWSSYGTMKKTTDGGLSWINQILPSGGIIIQNNSNKFSALNIDTLWAVGGEVGYPNNQSRGIIYKTTNGGTNWGYQLPDTTINIFRYYYSDFINNPNGWSYSVFTGVHTITGGDSNTIYTGIHSIGNDISNNFKLTQNYPNPFNPNTTINYQLSVSGHVILKIFSTLGKHITTLVNEKQTAGTYQVNFDGSYLPSGIYFYKIEIESEKNFFTNTRKMVLVR